MSKVTKHTQNIIIKIDFVQIEAYLQTADISPVTHEKLTSKDLIPNESVRHMIQRYVHDNPHLKNSSIVSKRLKFNPNPAPPQPQISSNSSSPPQEIP